MLPWLQNLSTGSVPHLLSRPRQSHGSPNGCNELPTKRKVQQLCLLEPITISAAFIAVVTSPGMAFWCLPHPTWCMWKLRARAKTARDSEGKAGEEKVNYFLLAQLSRTSAALKEELATCSAPRLAARQSKPFPARLAEAWWVSLPLSHAGTEDSIH